MSGAEIAAATPFGVFRARRLGQDRWLFSDERLAKFAADADIPDTTLALGGTMVQPLDLYGSELDGWSAAGWLMGEWLVSEGISMDQVLWLGGSPVPIFDDTVTDDDIVY